MTRAMVRLPLPGELALVAYLSFGWMGHLPITTALFGLAAGFVGFQTFLALRRISRTEGAGARGLATELGQHALLHAAPLGYLATRLWQGQSLALAWFWYLPIILFFYTGRRLWTRLYEETGNGLYRLFITGNTVVPTMLTVFLALGSWRYDSIGSAQFDQLLMFYIFVHLFIAGRVLSAMTTRAERN
jgi:hypothetical protein